MALTIGGVAIADAWREPPRQPHAPYARRSTYAQTFDTAGVPGEVVTDMGQDLSKQLRLVSSENIGFLTKAEVDALEALYNTGGTFILTWDRLPNAAPGNTTTANKTAYFDPDTPPLFTLVNEQKDRWYMDIVLRIKEL